MLCRKNRDPNEAVDVELRIVVEARAQSIGPTKM